MRLAEWVPRLCERASLRQLLGHFQGSIDLHSVPSEARPFIVAAAYRERPRRTLILTGNYDRCLAWQAKLGLCGVPADHIRVLPSGLSALFEDATPEQVALSDRIGALEALLTDEHPIVIATAPAALERTLPRDVLEATLVRIRPGDTMDAERLRDQVAALGYEYAEPVRLPGQFSQRGGIFDIFATGHDLPLRIELFGDEVESIRAFDPTTQRSVGNRDELRIAPSRETVYMPGEPFDASLLRTSAEREGASLDEESAKRLEDCIGADAEALESGIYFDRLDLYRPWLHPDSGCAIDLLETGDWLILDEALELDAIVSRSEDELGQSLQARSERGEILHATAHDFILPADHVSGHGTIIALSSMNAAPDWLEVSGTEDAGAASLQPYRGRSESLAHTLANWLAAGFLIVVATDQPNRATAMLQPLNATPTEEVLESGVVLAQGNLGGGFVIPEAKLAVLTDAELFGVARLRLPQKKFLEGAPIATLLDLKPGDYVVHIQFGVGRYRGLVTKVVDGIEREFLFLEYSAPDRLFVPADQLDRIQKYLNPSETEPKLNRLTGTEWQKTIAKAREDAQAFARDLVQLYAERRMVQRKPIGPDTPWQGEMEATFPWVETPSQLAAIKDSKRDLSASFPMDRLVCGDVGFGKTEVAIRCAFKVAQAGKQVAVLCPTTILSEQHFRNFTERLGSFPVRLEVLNRFRKASERTRILKAVEAGEVDILIGTHALLTGDLTFKDLGLVVVDEEQKFGVKQKEALKKLRAHVDFMSLSATPIPRTLSMALMDIRQMSLINDPPPGRLPIRTFVRPYGPGVVREAILRELARGGQIFYVYNRVESIYHVAEKLQRLAPMARIGVGHGQMSEAELEPVMIGFIRGEIDILLSTTIVENGIDIPNANTLIVEQADRLGLAQLYQLRGRVGRSDRQAYAYLLYGSHKELSETAMARLQALQEFSTLGSGYSLAFRDLQIRGAGELLGKKQHGAMASVGYELYTQLIEEAVRLLKTSVDGKSKETPTVSLSDVQALPQFDLAVEAHLPPTYIREEPQRLYYYQQLMTARTADVLGEVEQTIEDRYGHLPEPARNAFQVMRLRLQAAPWFDKVEAKGGRVSASFRKVGSAPPRALSLMSRGKRDSYVTGDRIVWPYMGSPLLAVSAMLDSWDNALREVEEARQALADSGLI